MARVQCKNCENKPSEHDTLNGYCMICAGNKIKRAEELEKVIDHIAVHTLHLFWITDSESWPELKHYFDTSPRGLSQHIGEIQTHCAEAGSKIAQTGKI